MRRRNIKGLTRPALLATLFLSGTGVGLAQHSGPHRPGDTTDNAGRDYCRQSKPTATPSAVASGVMADPVPDTSPACDPSTSIWSKVPPPVMFPWLGAFSILPTGPGYYSLKDVLTDNYLEKPPVYPWPPFTLDLVPFFDNNSPLPRRTGQHPTRLVGPAQAHPPGRQLVVIFRRRGADPLQRRARQPAQRHE